MLEPFAQIHSMHGYLDDRVDPRAESYTAKVRLEPLGVIFAITPYNWPYNLAAHKIAPAIATGNSVILKPSPLGALSSLTLARLIHEAGAPPGIINSWNGPTPLVQKAIQDPRIAMVSFTGSVDVGWSIKDSLPRKPVTLELGGDAYVFIDESADIDRAVARCVFGSFAYAGQICISVQHILVHEKVYEEFKEKFVAATLECHLGDPRDPAIILGPMIHEATAEKVESWIQEAIDLGATPLVRGKREKNRFGATVLENVPKQAKLGHQEVFGPVVTLSEVANFREAIETINAGDYGIQAGIFSQDKVAIRAASELLEVGGVVINDVPTTRFDALPYGGVKQSGYGREGVHSAMLEMTRPKTLLKYGRPNPDALEEW